MADEVKPPIKSGWKGNQNGYVEDTDTTVQVSKITIEVDHKTAWALCNILTDSQLKASGNLETDQVKALSNLGAAVGRMIDHSAANNGGRAVLKP